MKNDENLRIAFVTENQTKIKMNPNVSKLNEMFKNYENSGLYDKLPE